MIFAYSEEQKRIIRLTDRPRFQNYAKLESGEVVAYTQCWDDNDEISEPRFRKNFPDGKILGEGHWLRAEPLNEQRIDT